MRFKWAIPSGVPSRARVLQLAACAVLAWAWLRSEPTPSSSPPLTSVSSMAPSGAPAAGSANSRILQPPAEPPQEASLGMPNVLGAQTIEVIVSHNDTLDRIFRRLKLDMSDLASLRNLPGLKSALDHLRPGEALHLIHRDGSLFGFERQLSP